MYREFLIFLRNDCDCEVVDPYNARKRYAVIEKVWIAWELYVGINLTSTLDPMRKIFWLASGFSKIKKPNLGNQTVIAGVCIFDTISYIYPEVIFWFELQLVNLHGTREIYKIERYRVKEC